MTSSTLAQYDLSERQAASAELIINIVSGALFADNNCAQSSTYSDLDGEFSDSMPLIDAGDIG
jgi:hypothetical protein